MYNFISTEQQLPLLSPHHFLVTIILLPTFISLTILDASYKRIHALFVPLRLTYFTLPNVFEGLISKIYKELLQLNSKKPQITQILKRTRDLNTYPDVYLHTNSLKVYKKVLHIKEIIKGMQIKTTMRKRKQSWKTHSSHFENLLESYSNQSVPGISIDV